MRILIISTFFPPLNSIASLRPYSWAKYWTEAGHDVTVLTIQQTQDPDTAQDFTNSGFKIIEIPTPLFLNKLKKDYQNKDQPKEVTPQNLKTKIRKNLVQFFNWLRFKKGVFNACRMPDFSHLYIKNGIQLIVDGHENYDAVISTAGPYTTHIIAAALKRRKIAKQWIADYRDPWSNNHIYPGIFPFNLIERLWEKKLLQRADIITTVSDPFSEEMRSLFNHSHVETIPNGFDCTTLSELSEERIFANDNKFRIVYTGTLHLGKSDPSPLFQAIDELNHSHFNALDALEILFVGPRQANLGELIQKYKTQKWVKGIDQISHKNALRMQRDANALLFLPWKDPSIDGVLTGKIFEYLFSGTPIIAVGCSHLEASQQLILDAKAGLIFHDVAKIKEYLIHHLTNPTKEKITVSSQIKSTYDRRNLAEKLLKLMTEKTEAGSHNT